MKKIFFSFLFLALNCQADMYEQTTLVAEDSIGTIQEIINVEEIEQEAVKDEHIIKIKLINIDLFSAEKIQQMLMLRLKGVAIMEGCKVYITEKRNFEVSEHTDIVIDCLTEDKR